MASLIHISHALSQAAELSEHCGTPIGENAQKLVPHTLQTSPHVPSSLADFALDSLVGTNRSHEYNYMLGPPQEVVLGTPNIVKERSQNRTVR